jgi:hypothetical protein
VLRPPIEVTDNRGARIIAKHKGENFRETSKPRPVVDPDKMVVLAAAQDIADEWVTPERLRHVLGKIEVDGKQVNMSATPIVIAAMIEDVYREGQGEIVESREAKAAIGSNTARLLKKELQRRLTECDF